MCLNIMAVKSQGPTMHLLDMGIAIKKPGFEQCLTLGVLSWRTQAGLSSWQLSLDCVIWYLNFSSSVNKEDFFDCFFLS